MNAKEAAVLIDAVRGMIDPHPGRGPTPDPPASHNGRGERQPQDEGASFERLYLKIKARLTDELRVDPILLHLVMQQPELVVEVEPRVIKIEGTALRGRVARLMAAGWFDQTRSTSSVRSELARTGGDPGGGGGLSDVLGTYVRDGFLVRHGTGYQRAPGVKITERALTVV